jgi:hypothetical protein
MKEHSQGVGADLGFPQGPLHSFASTFISIAPHSALGIGPGAGGATLSPGVEAPIPWSGKQKTHLDSEQRKVLGCHVDPVLNPAAASPGSWDHRMVRVEI